MSAGKLTWGRRDWLGLMVLFSFQHCGGCDWGAAGGEGYPAHRGAWLRGFNGGWALGAFLGVRVAVRGRSGTVQAALLLAAGAYVLIWLVGLTVFGTAAFAHHGLGITAGGGGWCAAGSRAGAGETASKKEACSAGTATSRGRL